ncbi:MAG: Piwi domain-containing protein [Thermoplasmatales archaeon]
MKLLERLDLEKFKLKFSEVEGLGSDLNVYSGLKKNGPYRKPANDFEEILVMCKRDDLLYAESFVEHFKNGYPRIFDGFNQIMRTTVDFRIVTFPNEHPLLVWNSFRENKKEGSFPVILMDIPKRKSPDSAYYDIKAKFVKEGIGVQIVRCDTVKNEEILKWSLLSLSIQIYAKMGGIPYILERSFMSVNEPVLVMGIGFSIDPMTKERMAGYILFYDENGNWLMSESSAFELNFESKLGDLAESHIISLIRSAFDRLRSSFNFEAYPRYNLIVHYMGAETGPTFESSILRAVERFIATDYNKKMNVYVVKIRSSNFLLVDEESSCSDKSTGHNTGLPIGGLLTSGRGYYMLSTTGCYYGRSNVLTSGSPSPILISIRSRIGSDFTVPEADLIKSVFAMCRLNYVSVSNPVSRLPVTVKYARELALVSLRIGRPPSSLNKIPWFI